MKRNAGKRLSLIWKRDLVAATLLGVLIVGQWAYMHGFFGEQPLLATFTYRGDALFTAAGVTAAKRGEYVPFLSKNIPSLGAPFVANWDDFPVNEDVLIFAIGTLARVTGVFGAINIFYGLAVLLAALTMFFVGRRFHFSRPGSFLAGYLYGLSTFLFMRTVHHFSYTFYFFFPAVVLVAAWLTSRKGIELRSRKMKAAVAVMLTAATSVIYFVYFTVQVLGIAVAATFAKTGLKRWRVVALLAGVGALAAMSMELDSVLFWRREGVNHRITDRDPRDVEQFALKPINFVAPALGAGSDRWRSKLADAANREALTRGEAPGPYLGVIGCLAGLGLLAVTLVSLARGKAGLIATWGLMACTITGLNSVGGLNSFMGLFGFAMFRSVNRASIVVLTYVLLFLAWAFPRITKWLPTPGKWVLAVGLSLWGVWEQSIGDVKVPQDANHMLIFNSDKALVADAESKLPPGARIFCLPAVDFPEAWEKGTDSYEMFRPYFFAEKLVFSHGDIKGRPHSTFKQEVEKLPLPEMFATLRKNGFEGIYVNLRPYGGAQALGQFQQAGATVVSLSQLQDSAFLRLP